MKKVPWCGFSATPRWSAISFREAAALYVRAGREARYLPKLLDYFGEKSLGEIDQAALEEGARILFPTHSAGTQVRQLFVPMIAVLNFSAEQGLCEPRHFNRPPVHHPVVSLPTDEKVRRFIRASRKMRGIMQFMRGTGARGNEVAALQWHHVDLNRAVVVLGAAGPRPGRTVPMPADVLEALARLKHRDGPVFQARGGRSYKIRNGSGGIFAKSFRAVCDAAGVDGITPKVLRHLWALEHWAAHQDFQLLMTLGGWKDERMLWRLLAQGSISTPSRVPSPTSVDGGTYAP